MIKNFEIEYHNQIIKVENSDHYRLTWPDGRNLFIYTHANPGKEATSGSISRQNRDTIWMIKARDGGPDWVNNEQLQVLGELINRKEMKLQNEAA